jgi:hypothetical protein
MPEHAGALADRLEGLLPQIQDAPDGGHIGARGVEQREGPSRELLPMQVVILSVLAQMGRKHIAALRTREQD